MSMNRNRGNAVKQIGKLGRLAVISGALLLGACSGESAQSLVESAKKHLGKSDSKAAVIQLKNALQKDPKLAEARFMLGKLMLESGDVVGAGVELQKAQELGYDIDKLAPLRAKALLAAGQADKVIAQYGGQVLGTPAAQADLQVILALAQLSQGKRAAAQAAVAAALQADPNQVEARLLQVRMLASAKDIKGANEALDKVIASVPANSEARQLKGDLLLSEGRQDEALAAFKAAIEKDKANVGAHGSVIWILMSKKDLAAADAQLLALRAVAPQSAQTQFFSAMIAFDKGDLKSAHEQAQQLLKRTPDNVRALQLNGAIELRQGALVQAEGSLSKALQMAPNEEKIRSLLAQTHLRAGDPAKAVKLLQPLVDGPEPNWEAVALMAQALLLSGDADKAASYFAQAAKLNPQDSRSRTVLALADVAKGRVEQGFDELQAISATDTGPVADLAMISAHLRRKDYDSAFRAIDQLEKKQAHLPIAANLRGQTELQRGRREPARAAFEAALKIDPAYFPAAASIAAMDVQDGKPELAQQRFEKMLTVDPRNIRASMALMMLRSTAGASPEELSEMLGKTIKANPIEPAPRLALVRLQLSRKEFKLALAAAQDGLAAIPDSPELIDALGQVHSASGDYNQAVSTYNKLVALQPNSPAPLMRLAEAYAAQKDTAAAAQYMKRALTVKADYVPAQRGLILIELAAGRYKEARSIARTVQVQQKDNPVGYALEGDIEINQKNWAAAVVAYRAGISKRPSAELAIKLHRTLLAAGKPEEARKHELQWIEQHRQDATFITYSGDLALEASNYELAQTRYAAVLELQPESAAMLNNMAWLLNRAKKPGALDYALKASKLAPKSPVFMDTLAEVYASNGQLPKAIETQKAAVAAGPELHPLRLSLARMYVAAGEKVLARQELSRLAELGEKFPQQAEVKALMAKL